MSTTNIEFLGHPTHGGWHADSSHLNPKSIVYAFGVGDDITWDLALIEKYGCTIHAFDPDPHSNAWLAKQEIPPQLIFRAEGIAAYDGTQRFYDPYNKNNISMSTIRKNRTFSDLPVKRLQTFMHELGHDHIDLLKMDIEGSEYAVIPDILKLDIRQILVELHPRFFRGWKGFRRVYGWLKTKIIFWEFKHANFIIVHVRGQDYTFIRNKNFQEAKS
jgi:FkbM family methyltransferase